LPRSRRPRQRVPEVRPLEGQKQNLVLREAFCTAAPLALAWRPRKARRLSRSWRHRRRSKGLAPSLARGGGQDPVFAENLPDRALHFAQAPGTRRLGRREQPRCRDLPIPRRGPGHARARIRAIAASAGHRPRGRARCGRVSPSADNPRNLRAAASPWRRREQTRGTSRRAWPHPRMGVHDTEGLEPGLELRRWPQAERRAHIERVVVEVD
jgi:hypothetical protein